MTFAFWLLLTATAPTQSAQQLVVVTSASWTAQQGRLQRFERTQTSAWQAVGPAVDVVVGEGGLGWGIGEHEFASGPADPRKREGDGRAPAGVFALTRVVGKTGVPKTRMPTHVAAADDVCVDDVGSAFYNTIHLDAAPHTDPRSWRSFEALLRSDSLYDLLVIVNHNHIEGEGKGEAPDPDTGRINASAPVKGAGSCVFLHVWRRPGSPTIGCTALNPTALTDLVMWLDPAKHPLLVQLPRDVYARVRDPWQLP